MIKDRVDFIKFPQWWRFTLTCLLLFVYASGSSKDAALEVVDENGQRITYELIYQDVSNLLNVTPGGKEVFIRWELPVRYYVEGLERYPDKAKLFDDVAQEIAKLTGHDIQRHQKIFWPSNKTMFHPDSPDNRFSNANFFFYSDFERLAKSDYIKAAKLLGQSLETEREEFFELKKTGKNRFSKTHFSGSVKTLMYFNSFNAYSNVDDITYSEVLGDWIDILAPLSNTDRTLVFSERDRGRYHGNALNQFDQLFLSIYYQTKLSQSEDELRHGINNEKAAQMIAKEMWFHYQQGSGL